MKLHLKNLERLKSDHGEERKERTSRELKIKGQPTAQKILNAGIFLKKGRSWLLGTRSMSKQKQKKAQNKNQKGDSHVQGDHYKKSSYSRNVSRNKKVSFFVFFNFEKKNKNMSVALKYKKPGNLFEGKHSCIDKIKPHKFESQFISSRTGLQLNKEDFLRIQTNSGKSEIFDEILIF